MSDSEEDFMPNNVLKYQHERPGIRTQVPNRNNNNTHITSFSIRDNNMMTSTFDMQNYERQRYRGAFDQRSMCYRRETSPMSLRSFPDSGIQRFRSSYYPRGMSSQRSVFNGRSGSPVSVRSIDSNASISAADIALAFKNVNFNKYDLRIIKEAYSKFMKNRVRKRMEKRRNLKLFLKGTRKDTGYDSGELGSDSSISSDDCRSTRTAIYKENLPVPRPRPRSRPLKMDMTQLKNTIHVSDMYQDCTENFKQNSLRNMLLVKKNTTQVNVSVVNNTTIPNPQNGSLVSMKDRFEKGNSFVLPSQRFTRSGNKINDEISRSRSNTMQSRQAMCNFKETAMNKSLESNSGTEEIFSEVTVRENVQESTLLPRKRNCDLEEANYSEVKRKKFTSPIKHSESLISSTLINTQNNDCIFKKPQMPVRKSTIGKNTLFNDKLIAKSAPPIADDFEPDFNLHSKKQVKNNDTALQYNSTQQVPETKETEDINNETEVSQNTTDVSMKPSFNKRKLFSQKLDVLDKKNQSTDNLNSPQTKLYAGEKHKVRKLASSQSCLNLDVLGNDNVLDLIHKIVPRDKMNITNAHNKKETQKSQDEDKWDVTSVISMCNNEDVSDTFTDEEIFKVPQSTTNTKANNNKNKVINMTSETNQSVESKKVTKQKINEKPKNKNAIKKTKLVECKVTVNKLSPNICNNYNEDKTIQSRNKRTVSSCVKSFWDTDFESDMEERTPFTWNSKFAADKDQENNSVVNNIINMPKKNGLKSTVLTVRSTLNKGVNTSSRSDRKYSQRMNQNDNQEIKENIETETLNKKSKSNCKINLNSSVTQVKNKGGGQKQKDLKKTNSAQKGTNKKKETSNKKNNKDAVKKMEPIKLRILTPRKVNEKKRQSSPKSSESSFNISSKSLRVREKQIDYRKN